MAKLGAGRGSLRTNAFKNEEMDWLFRRVLLATTEHGAEIGECLWAADQINERTTESWITVWSGLGDRLKRLADESYGNGRNVSARECYLRAATYYRTAEYLCVPSDPRFHSLWEQSRSVFHQACALFDVPIQPLTIDFEGNMLPAYFWPAPGEYQTAPTLFHVGGNDDSAEEGFFWTGPAAHRRGYNYFTFEYPGHRGAVHLYPNQVKRADYEVPFRSAFDTLEALPGVDHRIALNGFSHGGYVVCRVAVHEPRVTALIPTTPLIDANRAGAAMFGPLLRFIPRGFIDFIFERRLPPSSVLGAFVRYTLWSAGYDRLSSALKNPPNFVIEGEEHRITCPTLSLAGEGEGQELIEQTKRFHEAISSSVKKLKIFTLNDDASDDHCQLDNRSRANQVMFDWLDGIFDHVGPRARSG